MSCCMNFIRDIQPVQWYETSMVCMVRVMWMCGSARGGFRDFGLGTTASAISHEKGDLFCWTMNCGQCPASSGGGESVANC